MKHTRSIHFIRCFAACAAIFFGFSAAARTLPAGDEWENPAIPALNKALPRNEFISYDLRNDAIAGNLGGAQFYRLLTGKLESPPTEAGSRKSYTTQVNLPHAWLDREVFLHVEGLLGYYIYVNDAFAGYGTDSRTPSEFNISAFIHEGVNTVRIEVYAGGAGAALETAAAPEAPRTTPTCIYLYSQPKLRIEDFDLMVRRDSTGRQTRLKVALAVASSYNYDETFTVGYDIYSPQGKRLHYDMRSITLAGHSRDTIRLEEYIYGVVPNLWSAESPSLYRMLFFVRRSGRATEHIPYQIGFGETEFKDGRIWRNGKPVDLRPVHYNAAPEAGRTEADLKAFKSLKYNTIYVDYPQPVWFYELCDRIGFYVIDQANLNSNHAVENRDIGGSYANDPQWLPSYLDRTQGMFSRNRQRTCIVGWSLGGNGGNGYNLYRTYLLLKESDPYRAVIYRGAKGEWNSDIELPEAVEGAQALSEAAAVKPAAATRRR